MVRLAEGGAGSFRTVQRPLPENKGAQDGPVCTAIHYVAAGLGVGSLGNASPPAFSEAEMQKPPPVRAGVFGLGSLTITYFHTGIRTIIGVESFHGPVRDGKGWDRLAMVIRQRGLFCWRGQQNQSWKKQ